LSLTAQRVAALQLPEDFEQIFVEHSRFVYRTALRVTGDTGDAEDVVQSLFLRLLTHGLPVEVRGNPRGYLYRSAVNMSLNVVRVRKRNVLTDSEEALDATVQRLRSPIESEAHDRLRQGLTQLSPKAADILILRYVHGYKVSEIASFLETSQGTVAVELFRARLKLKRIVKSLGEKP
jgi:RNA polymerase sigma-70 factor (ECF subfamily)